MASIWTHWSRSLLAYSFDSWSLPMKIRTWNLIAHCWAFSRPADNGGISRGDRPVGEPGSVILRVWPCIRACQKAVGRNMLFPKYVST